MNIRLAADLQTDSIVDGPGLRMVLWTQGCAHNCKGCHNPSTHDFNGGGLIPVDIVCDEISKVKYHTGITFSGGDPMYQPKECAVIADYCKKLGYDVWTYTGFTFDEILKLGERNHSYIDFLKSTDVLVDGLFVIEKRNLNLLFRGSENQRLIDVKKSLEENQVVLLDENKYFEMDKFVKANSFI